jgi:hypothetical protein
MDKHVVEWLGAYQDGELQPDLASLVRDHLAVCGECRQELASLEALSGLLRSLPVSAPDPVKAATLLKAQLPDRVETISDQPTREAIWWFLPTLVVVTALILQIATQMTLFMLVADWLGFGYGLEELFPGLAQTTTSTLSWSSLLSLSLQGDPTAILGLMNSVRQSVDFLFAGITWQLALAFLYTAWMVVVWNKRSHLLSKPAELVENRSGSIGV